MTVGSTISSITGLGNGVTLNWPFPFIIPIQGDAVVEITDNTVTPPLVTTLNNAQYSIIGLGNPAGGSVNYPIGMSPTPLAAGVNITTSRVVPLVQDTSIGDQGQTFAAIEGQLDYLTFEAQQIQAQLTLFPLVPPGATTSLTTWLASVNTAIATTAASATAAAASATSASTFAAGLLGTSVTSLVIGTGSKTFATQAGKQFAAGQFILASSNANANNYMHGTVTSYTGTSLIVNVTDTGGSGTHTDWNISVSGSQGSAGSSGITGPTTSTVVNFVPSWANTGGTNLGIGYGVSTSATASVLVQTGAGGTIDTSFLPAQGIPSGGMIPYGGSSAPSGWLLCSGQAVSRSTYATLFGVISTTFGIGDGSTTFNVPDMRGRAAFGADAMGGTPANRLGSGNTGGIVGSAAVGATGGQQSHTLTSAEQASMSVAVPGIPAGDGGGVPGGVGGSGTATSTATGGGGAHNVLNPALVMNFIIKT